MDPGLAGRLLARQTYATADSTSLPTEEEERWRRWVDDRFVRVITINIYRNARESFQTFEYIAEQGNFSWAERQGARVIGAGMMWALSGAEPGLAVSASPWSHLPCGTDGLSAGRPCRVANSLYRLHGTRKDSQHVSHVST